MWARLIPASIGVVILIAVPAVLCDEAGKTLLTQISEGQTEREPMAPATEKPGSRRTLQFQAATAILILVVLVSVLTEATSTVTVVLSSVFTAIALVILGMTLNRLRKLGR